jgi:U3 small nucleolar RNA-associated protein 10
LQYDKTDPLISSDNTLSQLNLFIEALSSSELPESLELLTHLLQTLGQVMQVSTTATTDISFLQQMLMSAIENVASKIRVLFSSALV